MKILSRFLLLAMIIVWASSTINQPSSQSTCPNSFNEFQIQSATIQNEILSKKLQLLVKNRQNHLIKAIAKMANNQNRSAVQIASALQSDIISEMSSCLIGFIALGVFSLCALYKLFFEKLEKKDKNRESIPQKKSKTLKIRISLAGVVISLILVFIFSIKGYRQSNKIDNTLKSFICTILQPSNGYHRNLTIDKPDKYDHQWYIQQIKAFQNQISLSEDGFFPLIYDNELQKLAIVANQTFNKILAQTNKSTDSSKFIALLNSSVTNIQNISNFSFIISRFTEETFAISIECFLQIIRIYQLIKNAVRIEVLRFSDLILKPSEYLMKLFYVSLLAVAIFSVVAVCKITLDHMEKSFYIRDIALLLLIICGFISLSFSITTSMIYIPLQYINETWTSYTNNQTYFIHQLAESEVISDFTLTISSKFHPNSNGDYLDIGNRLFINLTQQLAINVGWYLKNGQSIKKQLKQEGKKLLKDDDKQLMKYLDSITLEIQQEIKLAQGGLNKMLTQTSPNSALYQTDPRGLGKHITKIVTKSLSILNNLIEQHRIIVGCCSFFILLSIVSLIFLRKSSTRQIIAVNKELQMFNKEEGGTSEQSELSL